MKLIQKHQKGQVVKFIKDFASDAKKIVRPAKVVNKTGEFISEDELLDMFETAKVFDTQNKVKFDIDNSQAEFKLPRGYQSLLGMKSVNNFLDQYMKKYPTQSYVDWARTRVKLNPYDSSTFYSPDGVGDDLYLCRPIRNQIFYDLREIKDRGLNLSPAKIKKLQEYAEQMNEIYKDLIYRQAIINFINGKPFPRYYLSDYDEFSDLIKQYGK